MRHLNHNAFVNACRDERGVGHHTLRAYAQDLRTEPPRVYRRVSGSIVMPLSQRRSSLRRMPPLSLVA